jgi:hypothetical protein
MRWGSSHNRQLAGSHSIVAKEIVAFDVSMILPGFVRTARNFREKLSSRNKHKLLEYVITAQEC